MPLSARGEAIKKKFTSKYGKKKGESAFYATERKHPKFATAVGGLHSLMK